MREQFEFIKLRTADGIARVTLCRPPLNVMNIPMLMELNESLEAVLSDRNIAAVVFRSEGKAFSAGVDVADHTPDKTQEMIRQFHGIFRKLLASDVLSIAAVPGAALGGGCELACACDVVLASGRAQFGQPEIQVGVFPPVAAAVLPWYVGLKKAVELTVLGARIDANEALRIGLVNHVYPAECFETEVDAFLTGVAKLSRAVIRLAKRAVSLNARQHMLAQLEQAERLYADELMRCADAQEGIEAFLGRRAAVWRHA